jgi:hypothetical protein
MNTVPYIPVTLVLKYKATHDLHRIFVAYYCASDAREEIEKQLGDAVERVQYSVYS